MYSLLIAEDEILERRMLEKIIRKEFPLIGALWIAEHGLQALELIREHRPDILLLDINMPGMMGMELIHALRQEKFGGPILILTAYNDFAYAQQAIDHEVLGYLLKPVNALQCAVLWARFQAPLLVEAREAYLREKLSAYDEYFHL